MYFQSVYESMIESLVEDLPSLQIDEMSADGKRGNSACLNGSEESLIASLPIVQKILRRKISFSQQNDASDILQAISLRLWQWRNKFRSKSEDMSSGDWESFAARTAYNEINRHNSKRARMQELPLDHPTEEISIRSCAGETEAEVFSLLESIWQEICLLTLRQRRALLLHSQELIINLLQTGIGDDRIAGILELSAVEWAEVKTRLPLSDFQIAELIQAESKNKSLGSLTKSIKKARFEARKRIREQVKR